MNEWNILFFSHYNCFIQTTKNNSGKYAHHSYLMMRQQQQNALNLSATYTKKKPVHILFEYSIWSTIQWVECEYITIRMYKTKIRYANWHTTPFGL